MADIEVFRARNTTGLAINGMRVTNTKPYGLIQTTQLFKCKDENIIEALGADVQPIRHGRWICEFYNDVFDVYQADCSVCKKESTDKYDKVSESYEYCPHCGADMRGEDNG